MVSKEAIQVFHEKTFSDISVINVSVSTEMNVEVIPKQVLDTQEPQFIRVFFFSIYTLDNSLFWTGLSLCWKDFMVILK